MFNAHQIQVLKGMVEDAQLANLSDQEHFYTIKDQNLSEVLIDIEFILDEMLYSL